MAEEFEHQWSQDFEEPASKRPRLNSPSHQYPTGHPMTIAALEPIQHYFDPIASESNHSLRLFDDYWTRLLEESHSNTASLPESLLNFDPDSNSWPDYGEQPYTLSYERRPDLVSPTEIRINGYEQFAPRPAHDEVRFPKQYQQSVKIFRSRT